MIAGNSTLSPLPYFISLHPTSLTHIIMNRKQAAEFLNVSEKTVSRYVASGKLPARYIEGKQGRELDLTETDLTALRDGAGQGRQDATTAIVSPALAPIVPAPVTPEPLSFEQLLRAIVAETGHARQDALSVSIADKTLLTLDEAAALTGVPRSALNRARIEGTLRARKIGRAFRVSRADAEAFALSLLDEPQ